jgi:hypothetical protein
MIRAFFWLWAWLPLGLGAQALRVSGYVLLSGSGEAVAGAELRALGSRDGAIANAYGYFSLSLDSLPAVVEIRYPGLRSRLDTLRALPATPWRIELEKADYKLGEVLISSRRQALPGLSRLSLSGSELLRVPALGGETDALKALQMLPGVQMASEGSNGLVVRGGSPDQNLILLDGTPVYHVSHLLGIFSTFNPEAVRHVSLYKGGFPAQYGGRLASIAEVSLKEGQRERHGASGSLGLISSRLLLEGPLGKGSYLIAGRRTYLDLVAALVQRASSDRVLRYGFYDLTGKANLPLSKRSNLYLSLYGGDDRFQDALREEAQAAAGTRESVTSLARFGWGNRSASLRWSCDLGKAWFSEAQLYYTRYALAQGGEFSSTLREGSAPPQSSSTEASIEGHLRDAGLKFRVQGQPRPWSRVELGGGGLLRSSNAGRVEVRLSENDSLRFEARYGATDLAARELWAFASHVLSLGKRLEVSTGLHAALFEVQGQRFPSLQPRLSASFSASEALSFSASWARMTQFIHLLSPGGVSLPVDLWVAATERIPPSSGWTASLGGSASLPGGWQAALEGFWREMRGLIEYREGADLLTVGPEAEALVRAADWEEQVARGQGRSYGVEFWLRKPEGRLNGWLSYTWSRSLREFPSLNGGRPFPYRYDRPHSANLSLSWRWRPSLTLNLSVVAQSGFVATVATGSAYPHPLVSSPPAPIPYVPQVNNLRSRFYHRADLGLDWVRKRKRGERIWSLGVYNVYSRLNPYALRVRPGGRVEETALFPFIPSISWRFTL